MIQIFGESQTLEIRVIESGLEDLSIEDAIEAARNYLGDRKKEWLMQGAERKKYDAVIVRFKKWVEPDLDGAAKAMLRAPEIMREIYPGKGG
jgi:hypothetical protein